MKEKEETIREIISAIANISINCGTGHMKGMEIAICLRNFHLRYACVLL